MLLSALPTFFQTLTLSDEALTSSYTQSSPLSFRVHDLRGREGNQKIGKIRKWERRRRYVEDLSEAELSEC